MRKPRQIKPNAIYHVTARANRQEMILSSCIFKELFIDIMKSAKKKYHFRYHNFCIMNNHIHFIIEPLGKTNLSRIMQWILSIFALKYNRLHDYHGHVWYDRFKSRILNNIFEYLNAYIYVINNPVAAGIVKLPTDFHYNGISYISRKSMEIFMPS